MLFLETWKPQQNTEYLGRGGGWTANWRRPSVARARGAALFQNQDDFRDDRRGTLESWSLSSVTPRQLSPSPAHPLLQLLRPSPLCAYPILLSVPLLVKKDAMATWSRMPTEMIALGYIFSYEEEKQPR